MGYSIIQLRELNGKFKKLEKLEKQLIEST
jgi:hypothetical protein